MSAGRDRANLPGRLVAGRYRLVSPVGRGGMGAVWRAVDELLHREVALKEIQIPDGLPEEDREELRQRSLREARNAARLRHPSVITVHDVAIEANQPSIVMEYVPSRSLGDTVTERGPLPPVHVAQIGLAVLGALGAAHQGGVLHRDVKPSNVLLAEDGRVILADFGIARFEGDIRLTMTGRIMGSAGFIAPELAQGQKAATPACDLWSLGVTLYTAVEGRPPYDQSTFLARLTASATDDPAPMELAGPLFPAISGLMERDPGRRLGAKAAEAMLRAAAGTDHRSAYAPGWAPDRAPGHASRTGPATTPPARRGRRRRRIAFLLGVVAALGLILIAVAFTFLVPVVTSSNSSSERNAPPGGAVADPGPVTSSSRPVPPGPAPRSTSVAIPFPFRTGVTRYADPAHGFSVSVPARWARSTSPDFVLFTAPGANVQPDFLVSWEQARNKNPVAHLAEVEKAFIRNNEPRGYRRHRLERVRVPGGHLAGEWEFSYLREPEKGTRWRVLDQSIVTRDGQEYLLRWRVPEEDWTGSLPLLTRTLASFRTISPAQRPG